MAYTGIGRIPGSGQALVVFGVPFVPSHLVGRRPVDRRESGGRPLARSLTGGATDAWISSFFWSRSPGSSWPRSYRLARGSSR